MKARERNRLDRLVERARERHSPGVRGLRGRRAWRKLARASKRHPKGRAADALWESWVWDPDDKGWVLFRRWRGQKAVTDLHAAIAASPPRVGNWPGCAAFCVRNNLVPTKPVELARFYTLTRQPDQRRALDPDGSLLAAAYRAAGARVRTALRQALADEGDLDVVRAVVAGGDANSRVTGTEQAYLTRQFAASRDWAELWRLARDIPLPDAVDVVRMIDENWRPDGQRERDLYALLVDAGASGESLWRAQSALRGDTATRIKVDGGVVTCALSADSRRLAITTAGARGTDAIIVYALPDGRLVTRHSLPKHNYFGLAYLPDGTLILVDRETPDEASTRLYRCPDAGEMELVTPGDHGAVARAVRDYGATFHHAGRMTEWRSYAAPGYTLSEGGHISVVTGELIALRQLADKPQASWRHADLATAFAAAPLVNNSPAARPLYELLCACLEQRFGGEIGIGRERPEIGADEIGITRDG